MSNQAADDCGDEQANDNGDDGTETVQAPVPDPEELRARGQWLMWDDSDESPRRPHWRGDFSVSWTDPNDWHTSEEAIEAASEKPSWGIGYVFANTNDDYPRGIYGALDLDGCVDEDGRPKEWLPSLQPFFDRDAYMEFSPSGEGIHIPLAGFAPPSWWSDVDVPDAEHEGVEAYGSKFFTVTGDRLQGAGDTVADTGEWVHDWLAEAYEAITGEDPRQTAVDGGSEVATPGVGAGKTGSQDTDIDEWLDIEDIKDALDHIDPDLGYNDWRNVGYALVDFCDDKRLAKGLFIEWSRQAQYKWDSDAPNKAKRIIEDAKTATGEGDITVATLIHKAKAGGWDMPSPVPDTPGHFDIDDWGEDPREEGEKPDPGTHGFEAHNGGYGYWDEGDEDDGANWVEWTNFEIEVESFLSIEGDTEEMELTVHPRNGEPYNVTVEPTVFNEPRAFRREVACGRTTTFTGRGKALAKVKQFVGTQTAPELTGVRQMCRRDGRLVLPGGSLTADGWEEEPTHRYIKQDVGIERKAQLTPDNDEYDEDDVRSILELLPQTRDPERFLPAVGWFYATPIRPVITDEEGEFPILSITGGTGAGKTSTLETMWELFGVNGDPFSANGTTFSSMRMVSSTDSLPVWFDEYKPSDISDGRLDGFHDLVRKSTKGGVIPKGNADGTTTEHHLRAPVVVSGEQRFAGPAEQRRSVLATFKEETADPTGEHAHAYAQLTGGSYRMDNGQIEHYDGCDLTGHAMAYHQWLLGFSDEEIVERWHDAEKRVLDLLDTYGLGDVDSAGRVALQTIVLGIRLYRAFADEYGASVPFDVDDEDRALTYVAKQQGEGGRRESHLDEFIRLLSLTAMDDEIEDGRHYTETGGQKTGDREIRVHMGKTYPKVAQYVQNHGLHKGTELLDEQDYRERIKEQIEVDDSYITCYSQNTVPINRSFGIHIQRAEKAIEAFDREHFYGETDEADWANRKTEKIE